MKMFVQNICKSVFLFFFCSALSACYLNVSMAHTQGSAQDVIDDNASNTPNISPTVTVPMTPGSSITTPGQLIEARK